MFVLVLTVWTLQRKNIQEDESSVKRLNILSIDELKATDFDLQEICEDGIYPPQTWFLVSNNMNNPQEAYNLVLNNG